MRKLVFLLALVLSACGGGGGGGSSTPAVTAVASPVVTVAMYGDSTQAGSSWESWTPVPPSIAIQAVLRGQGHNVTVTSYGVIGSATYQLLYGLDGTGKTWEQQLQESGANVVVDNHGINDSWLGSETPLDTYRAQLTELVSKAKQQGKTMVLQTPTPVLPYMTGLQINIAAHDAKVQVMREVAAATGAVLCDLNKAVRDAGLATQANILDGIHPSRAMYEGPIASFMASCLAPLVK